MEILGVTIFDLHHFRGGSDWWRNQVLRWGSSLTKGPPRWTIPKQIWGLDTQQVSASKKNDQVFYSQNLAAVGTKQTKTSWTNETMDGVSSDKYRNFPPPLLNWPFQEATWKNVRPTKATLWTRNMGKSFFTVWNFQVRTKSEEHQSEKTQKHWCKICFFSRFFAWRKKLECWWFRKPANQLIWQISHIYHTYIYIDVILYIFYPINISSLIGFYMSFSG